MCAEDRSFASQEREAMSVCVLARTDAHARACISVHAPRVQALAGQVRSLICSKVYHFLARFVLFLFSSSRSHQVVRT